VKSPEPGARAMHRRADSLRRWRRVAGQRAGPAGPNRDAARPDWTAANPAVPRTGRSGDTGPDAGPGLVQGFQLDRGMSSRAPGSRHSSCRQCSGLFRVKRAPCRAVEPAVAADVRRPASPVARSKLRFLVKIRPARESFNSQRGRRAGCDGSSREPYWAARQGFSTNHSHSKHREF
jgi:hypothetical protein